MPFDTFSSARHRAILCHFDGYSAALLFVRWADGSLLWPGPLPEGATPTAEAPDSQPEDAQTLRQAVAERLGLNLAELVHVPEFNEQLLADGQPVHVHLLRFNTFEAPGAAVESAGGAFKHLPALRGSAAAELALLREVFNLMVGGSSRR